MRLAERDPALGALALWCAHRDGADGPAAAWSTESTIWYAPAFSDLAPHEQVGLAAHHVLHIAFRHAPRSQAMALRFGEAFDAGLYNIATDALVNETLLLAGYALPRPCLLLRDLAAFVDADPADEGPVLARLDSDRLYLALAHPPRRGAGDKAGEPRRARIRAAADQAGHSADLVPGGTHDPDEQRPDAAEWSQRIARALAEGRRAGRGLGTLGFRLADLPDTAVRWEAALRGLVSRALLHRPRQSWRRPARRWLAMEAEARRLDRPAPIFEPHVLRDDTQPRIVLAVDSSGSIDDARLTLFAGQVAAIGRRAAAETHVLIFDEAVRARHRMSGPGWHDVVGRLEFTRGGGTSFAPVLAEAAALAPSIVIVLTDLDGPVGAAPGVPVLWAVPERPHQPPPFGRVLSLAR